MSTLLDVVTRASDDAGVRSATATVKARLIRHVNRVCSEMWDGFRWSFRYRNYRVVTDVDYTTGTITATNGSRTITGSGTTFLSTHKSWHINFTADGISNWYKVRKFTSTTQLELDVPYQGTTGSSKQYVLRHFDYVLPTEAWDLGSVIVTSDKRPCTILEPTSMDIIGSVPYYKGYPLAVSFYNSDSTATTYSTGTSSAVLNSTTVTGSGTSWLANVYPGDIFTAASNSYTVYSVDSDTSLTLYNEITVAIDIGTAYTIVRQFGRVMRVMWPSTDNYVLDIRALRKYALLVNDSDTNEILYRYPDTIIKKVAALEVTGQDDPMAARLNAEADLLISRARGEDDAMTPREAVAPIFSYRRSSSSYRDDIR